MSDSSDFSSGCSFLSQTSSSPEPSSSPPGYDVVSQFSQALALDSGLLVAPSSSLDPWTNFDVPATSITDGCRRMIKILLEKGCRGIGHGTRNQTLRDAIKETSWTNVLKMLTALGAKVTDVNCRGDTAVHLAYVHNATDGVFNNMLEVYLDTAMENVTNDDGVSLFHIACAKSPVETVQVLLERYPEAVNSQVALKTRTSFSGYTPLHFAVMEGRYEIVKLLLDKKADFCAPDRNNITPLHLALYCDDIKMIDLILSYDDKYEDCVNNFEMSHFMVACAGRNVNIVKKFLGVAVKRNLPESSMVKFKVAPSTKLPFAGYTALHFAAENGNFETVGLLLRHGAWTHAQTADMYTPLTLARLEKHEDVCQLLQHYSSGRSEKVIVKKMDSLQFDFPASCYPYLDQLPSILEIEDREDESTFSSSHIDNSSTKKDKNVQKINCSTFSYPRVAILSNIIEIAQ